MENLNIIGRILKKFGYHKQKSAHVLTDLDRQRASEMKSMKAELRHLEQMAEMKLRMNDVKEAFNPKTTPEEMIFNLLLKSLTTPPTHKQGSAPTQGADSLELDDNQLDQMLQNNSQYVKVAKNLDDEQIKEHIKKIVPNVGIDTLNRAILKIRGF